MENHEKSVTRSQGLIQVGTRVCVWNEYSMNLCLAQHQGIIQEQELFGWGTIQEKELFCAHWKCIIFG